LNLQNSFIINEYKFIPLLSKLHQLMDFSRRYNF